MSRQTLKQVYEYYGFKKNTRRRKDKKPAGEPEADSDETVKLCFVIYILVIFKTLLLFIRTPFNQKHRACQMHLKDPCIWKAMWYDILIIL